jgi:hypothetical protein
MFREAARYAGLQTIAQMEVLPPGFDGGAGRS